MLRRRPGEQRLEPALGQLGQLVLLDGEHVGVVSALGQQAEVPVHDLGHLAQRPAALEQDLRGRAEVDDLAQADLLDEDADVARA